MHKLLAVVGVLLLTAPALAQDKGPYKEPATGLLFPTKMGNWVRVVTREYGAGLGVSVGYNSEAGGVATIYVYDANLKSIGTGVSKEVKEHLEQLKKEITTAAQQAGRTVKLLSESEIAMGKAASAPRMVRLVYQMTEKDGKELVSHAYLTGYKNQFFKIRLTYAKAAQNAVEKQTEQLLGDLGEMLKK